MAPETKKGNKPPKKSHKKLWIGIGIGTAVAAAVAAIIAVVVINSIPKRVELTPSQAVATASMKVAVAVDKLDGSGSVSTGTCETFRELAKQFNPNTDWFKDSYCKFIIYADYNDTANTTTITLSDGTHAAIYTFDSDNNYLLDYEFTVDLNKGRGILITAS